MRNFEIPEKIKTEKNIPQQAKTEVNKEEYTSPTVLIEKEVFDNSVIVGNYVIYQLNIENTGDIDLVNFKLKETIPPGMIFLNNIIFNDGKLVPIDSDENIEIGITIEAIKAHTKAVVIYSTMVDSVPPTEFISEYIYSYDYLDDNQYTVHVLPQTGGRTIIYGLAGKVSLKVDSKIKDDIFSSYQEKLIVNPGDVVKFRIIITNDDIVPYEDGYLNIDIPRNLMLLPYSLVVGKVKSMEEEIDTTHISLGNLNPEQTLVVTYEAMALGVSAYAVTKIEAEYNSTHGLFKNQLSYEIEISEMKVLMEVYSPIATIREKLDYTIKICNNSLDAMCGIEVFDDFPEVLHILKGSIFVDGLRQCEAESLQEIMIPNLEGGENHIISFQAIIHEEVDYVINQASVMFSQGIGEAAGIFSAESNEVVTKIINESNKGYVERYKGLVGRHQEENQGRIKLKKPLQKKAVQEKEVRNKQVQKKSFQEHQPWKEENEDIFYYEPHVDNQQVLEGPAKKNNQARAESSNKSKQQRSESSYKSKQPLKEKVIRNIQSLDKGGKLVKDYVEGNDWNEIRIRNNNIEEYEEIKDEFFGDFREVEDSREASGMEDDGYITEDEYMKEDELFQDNDRMEMPWYELMDEDYFDKGSSNNSNHDSRNEFTNDTREKEGFIYYDDDGFTGWQESRDISYSTDNQAISEFAEMSPGRMEPPPLSSGENWAAPEGKYKKDYEKWVKPQHITNKNMGKYFGEMPGMLNSRFADYKQSNKNMDGLLEEDLSFEDQGIGCQEYENSSGRFSEKINEEHRNEPRGYDQERYGAKEFEPVNRNGAKGYNPDRNVPKGYDQERYVAKEFEPVNRNGAKGYNQDRNEPKGYDQERYVAKEFEPSNGYGTRGYKPDRNEPRGYDQERYVAKEFEPTNGYGTRGYNQDRNEPKGYEQERYVAKEFEPGNGYEARSYNPDRNEPKGYNQDRYGAKEFEPSNRYEARSYNPDRNEPTGYGQDRYGAKEFEPGNGYGTRGYNPDRNEPRGYDKERYGAKEFEPSNRYGAKGYEQERNEPKGSDQDRYGSKGYESNSNRPKEYLGMKPGSRGQQWYEPDGDFNNYTRGAKGEGKPAYRKTPQYENQRKVDEAKAYDNSKLQYLEEYDEDTQYEFGNEETYKSNEEISFNDSSITEQKIREVKNKGITSNGTSSGRSAVPYQKESKVYKEGFDSFGDGTSYGNGELQGRYQEPPQWNYQERQENPVERKPMNRQEASPQYNYQNRQVPSPQLNYQDRQEQPMQRKPMSSKEPMPKYNYQNRLEEAPQWNYEDRPEQPGQWPREEVLEQPAQWPREEVQEQPGQWPREEVQEQSGQWIQQEVQEQPGQWIQQEVQEQSGQWTKQQVQEQPGQWNYNRTQQRQPEWNYPEEQTPLVKGISQSGQGDFFEEVYPNVKGVVQKWKKNSFEDSITDEIEFTMPRQLQGSQYPGHQRELESASNEVTFQDRKNMQRPYNEPVSRKNYREYEKGYEGNGRSNKFQDTPVFMGKEGIPEEQLYQGERDEAFFEYPRSKAPGQREENFDSFRRSPDRYESPKMKDEDIEEFEAFRQWKLKEQAKSAEGTNSKKESSKNPNDYKPKNSQEESFYQWRNKKNQKNLDELTEFDGFDSMNQSEKNFSKKPGKNSKQSNIPLEEFAQMSSRYAVKRYFPVDTIGKKNKEGNGGADMEDDFEDFNQLNKTQLGTQRLNKSLRQNPGKFFEDEDDFDGMFDTRDNEKDDFFKGK